MKRALFVAGLLGCLSAPAFAVNVIVHPSNSSDLDQNAIKRIFLGKSKTFPSGSEAVPMGLDEDTTGYQAFSKSALNKSPSQLKAYWSKLVFTGKGSPPRAIASDAEMLALIAQNPNMIGYIEGDADGSVKVVATY